MSNTNTSWPAFPVPHLSECDGMTLRDYFAAKAVGYFLETTTERQAEYAGMDREEFSAVQAYMVADAMLKVRGE